MPISGGQVDMDVEVILEGQVFGLYAGTALDKS